MTQYGTPEFWTHYEAYVQESLPRHQRAVRMLAPTSNGYNWQLIDLGCGRSQESKRLFLTHGVFTVDADIDARPDLVADYRTLDVLTLSGLHPVGFVSLFSSECTEGPWENRALYENLFRQLTFLEWGLVSGFYYRGHETALTISEPGGIVSHQSTGLLSKSEYYTETKLMLDAPSTLFGPDVVEVWKLLERK